MNTKAKRVMSFILSLLFFVGTIAINKTEVLANDSTFTIESALNGSFTVVFKYQQRNVDLSNFTVNYEVNGVQKGNLPLTGITNVGLNSLQLFYTPFKGINVKQDIAITVFYQAYNKGDSHTKSYSFSIDPLKTEEIKIISKENGNFILQFVSSKTDVLLTDFSANLYVDGVNRGNLPLTQIYSNAGYNSRFKIAYEPLRLTGNAQEIEIELIYKNYSAAKIIYTLYSSGIVSDTIIGSEYEKLEESSFIISSTANGEIAIRFDSEVRSTLTKKDFYGRYFIDGIYSGQLDFLGVDEDPALFGYDYTVYFDKLGSKDKDQSVTILLFYEKEKNKRPEKDNFLIFADELIYETDILIENIPNFKDEVVIPKITIKEEGKNTIFPSSKSSTEYIKLELPEGFEFINVTSIKIDGYDGLKSAVETDISYGSLKGEESKRIALIGLSGVYQDRKAIGSLEISDIKIKAILEEAPSGEVKLRISGAGIPYERIDVANYSEFEAPPKEEEVPKENTVVEEIPEVPEVPSSYIVKLIDNVPRIFINDTSVDMDTSPYVQDERLMLPLTHVALAFKIPVDNIKWDEITRSITVIDGATTIKLDVGSKIMRINDIPTVMDAEVTVKDNRTFLPMRYLADALKFKTEWNVSTRMATLTR